MLFEQSLEWKGKKKQALTYWTVLNKTVQKSVAYHIQKLQPVQIILFNILSLM